MSISSDYFFYADVSYVDTSNALINFSNLTGNAELNEHPLSKYARGIFFSPNYNKQFFDAINWANNLGIYKTQLNLINPFNNSILENLFGNIPSAYPIGMIAYYVADDIDIENNSWPDRSGNNNATLVGTGFSISTDGLALQGTTSSSILFGNILNAEYTICSITSYSGTNNKTILNSADTNWIHGHYNGRSGVIAYELDSGITPTVALDLTSSASVMTNYGATFSAEGMHQTQENYALATPFAFGTPFTIVTRVKWNIIAEYNYIIELKDNNGSNTIRLGPWSNNKIHYGENEGGWINIQGDTILVTNTWYDIRVTHSGSEVKIYVNDNEYATGTANSCSLITRDKHYISSPHASAAYPHGESTVQYINFYNDVYPPNASQQLVSLTPFKSLPETYIHTIPASPELTHDQLKAQPQKYTINPTGWNGFSTTNDWSILISSNGVAEMLMRWGDSWGTPISYIIDNFNSPPAPAELSFKWKPPTATGLSIGIESPQVNGNVVPFSFVIAFDSSLYQSDSTNLTSITTGVQGDGAAIKLYRKVENGEWERPDIKSFSYNNNLTEADYNQFTSTPMVIPYYNASWTNNGTGDIRIDEFNLYNDVWTPPAPPPPLVHPQPLEPGVSNLGVPIPAENVNDSTGWSVAISANGLVLVVGDKRYGSENNGRARVYDWNVTNSVWQIRENTNIIGEEMIGVAAHEHTGACVATSADGNVIAVGDIYHDYPQGGAGRVRVWDWNTTDNKFHLRDDNTKLLYGFNSNEQLGKAISLSADGTIIAIGSHYWDKPSQWDQGMVRVFKWNGVSWSQLGNNTDIQGVSASDHLGESVALSSDGTILAVGVSHVEVPPGSQNWNRGEIHVYTYNSNNNIWNKRNMDSSYQGSNDYDILGWSIAISSDGNIVAAGGNNAYGGNHQGIGFVRIWEWNSNTGQYDKRGSDLPGNGNWKHFGHRVDLSADGKILVVGAAGWNQNLEGYVEVYMWNDIDEYIILTDRIIGSDINGSSSSQFGHSVSLNADGTILAVGAPMTSAGGHTYTFNVTYSSGSSSESNDWTVTCGTNAIASDGTQSILVNGNNITPVSEQGSSVYGSDGNISVNINNGNSSDFSDFAIKELIVWPRALTTDEMKSVSDYMIANLNSPVFSIPIPTMSWIWPAEDNIVSSMKDYHPRIGGGEEEVGGHGSGSFPLVNACDSNGAGYSAFHTKVGYGVNGNDYIDFIFTFDDANTWCSGYRQFGHGVSVWGTPTFTKDIKIYTSDTNFGQWTEVATDTHSTWHNDTTNTFSDVGTTTEWIPTAPSKYLLVRTYTNHGDTVDGGRITVRFIQLKLGI